MRFAAAPVYEVFPTREKPLKPYVAAVRASASTREVIRSCDPDVVVADIITSAASLAAQAEGRRVGDARAARDAHRARPGFPIYSIGAVYPRTALGRRFWGVRAAARDDRRGAGTRGAERGARAGGAAAAVRGARRDLARPRDRGDLPPARVPAPGRLAGHAGDGAALVGAAVRRRGAAAGRRAARARGAEHVAGSRAAARARGARGARRTSRCGCWRRSTGARPRRPSPCPRTRGSWIGSRTRGRCRCATRSCATPATGRWCARWRAACRWWRAHTPATRRRTRRGSAGPAWACRSRAASRRRADVRLAVRRLLADPRYRRRAEELRDWAAANDGAAAAADAVEELGGRASAEARAKFI